VWLKEGKCAIAGSVWWGAPHYAAVDFHCIFSSVNHNRQKYLTNGTGAPRAIQETKGESPSNLTPLTYNKENRDLQKPFVGIVA